MSEEDTPPVKEAGSVSRYIELVVPSGFVLEDTRISINGTRSKFNFETSKGRPGLSPEEQKERISECIRKREPVSLFLEGQQEGDAAIVQYSQMSTNRGLLSGAKVDVRNETELYVFGPDGWREVKDTLSFDADLGPFGKGR